MSDGKERFLDDLDARFDAAVRREELEAAEEFALALRLDQKIYEQVLTWKGARLADGPSEPVTEVSVDHVALGDPPTCFVPLAHAVLQPMVHPGIGSLKRSDEPMRIALKRWARSLTRVNVTLSLGSCSGILRAATPDHILVVGMSEFLIPYEAIRWISVSGGG